MQIQFSRWKFPARYKRAWTDEAFCVRLRELWEQNVRQVDMVRILQEEGYDVETRHIVNARKRLGLKLRETASGAGAMEDEEEDEGGEGGETSGDEDGEGEGSAPPPPPAVASEEVLRRIEERKAEVEQKQRELWATKKRRRHTTAYAGLAPDPPGPPRYPSEMTLTEAKAILQFDNQAQYKALREQWATMHQAEGSFRKAPNQERWQALTDRLIRENMHLRGVMWDQEGMAQKRLALDVICLGSVKQKFGARMSGVEALRVLGLDPQQGRETRRILHTIMVDFKFTNRALEGPERWAEVRRRWMTEHEALGAAMVRDGAEEEHKLREKAVKVISKDVCARYAQDLKKNGGLPLEIADIPALRKTRGPGKRNRQPAKPVDYAGPPRGRGRPRKEAPAAELTFPPQPAHTQSRLMPPDDDNYFSSPPSPAASMSPMDDDDPMDDDHPMNDDDQLDPSLLESQEQQQQPQQQQQQQLSPPPPPQQQQRKQRQQQNPLLNPQYIQGVIQAATQAIAPAPPIYDPHQHQQPLALAPAPAPIQTTTASGFAPTAVYFRLHPASFVAAPALWVSTLSTPSVGELRARAVDRFGAGSGVVCVRVEGLIKDPGGGDATLPLPVSDDGELGAYLEHVKGIMAPTFSVTLVEGGRGMEGGGGWV